MDPYVPPFTITNKMLRLTASVSEKAGLLRGLKMLETRPHLRRNNRIRSIHSSLRIESNPLSVTEVRDIIAGRPVLGECFEICEVKNAYSAYERMQDADPYSLEDLLSFHRTLMQGLAADAGAFRKGEEGVFSGGKCIFLAPPPAMVPELMHALFRWMRENSKTVHPLILSAVFHYEFVFIHPFSDGNGRTARLWHSILLSRWNGIFAYIPIENRIEAFQEGYYEVIDACHKNGNSDMFIEFMLERIDEALDELTENVRRTETETTEYVKKLLAVMEYDVPYTAAALMTQLGLKTKAAFHRSYMGPAIEQGLAEMTLPDKPKSKNQRYIRRSR